jgi:hypothetical protein
MHPDLHAGATRGQQSAHSAIKTDAGHKEVVVNTAMPAGPSSQPAQQLAQAQIVVKPPTDWPAIFAPFVLGAAAMYFTQAGQRQQIRSSTANFRHEWLKELREACVSFATAAGTMKLKNEVTQGFVTTPEFWQIVDRMISTQSKILVMLDEGDQARKQLREAMGKVIEHMGASEGSGFQNGLVEFRNACRMVLDDAWQDMKQDLGHSQPWTVRTWVRIRNSLKRKSNTQAEGQEV